MLLTINTTVFAVTSVHRKSVCPCVHLFVKMEFDKAGTQVVVVSFGSRDAAVQWRQETSCQYPILIDSKRQVKTTVVYVHS